MLNHLCFFCFQAIIKEQLHETQGMCEYAVYVQGQCKLHSKPTLNSVNVLHYSKVVRLSQSQMCKMA